MNTSNWQNRFLSWEEKTQKALQCAIPSLLFSEASERHPSSSGGFALDVGLMRGVSAAGAAVFLLGLQAAATAEAKAVGEKKQRRVRCFAKKGLPSTSSIPTSEMVERRIIRVAK